MACVKVVGLVLFSRAVKAECSSLVRLFSTLWSTDTCTFLFDLYRNALRKRSDTG